MSFATIYVTRENFNWMKVHLRIPRFNINLLSQTQYELLLDAGRFWNTMILTSQKQICLVIQPLICVYEVLLLEAWSRWYFIAFVGEILTFVVKVLLH